MTKTTIQLPIKESYPFFYYLLDKNVNKALERLGDGFGYDLGTDSLDIWVENPKNMQYAMNYAFTMIYKATRYYLSSSDPKHTMFRENDWDLFKNYFETFAETMDVDPFVTMTYSILCEHRSEMQDSRRQLQHKKKDTSGTQQLTNKKEISSPPTSTKASPKTLTSPEMKKEEVIERSPSSSPQTSMREVLTKMTTIKARVIEHNMETPPLPPPPYSHHSQQYLQPQYIQAPFGVTVPVVMDFMATSDMYRYTKVHYASQPPVLPPSVKISVDWEGKNYQFSIPSDLFETCVVTFGMIEGVPTIKLDRSNINR